MNHPVLIDQSRAAFVRAFEQYAREGARMRDLLLSLDRPANSDSRESVQQQQQRLNEARALYEAARKRYIELVLYDTSSRDLH